MRQEEPRALSIYPQPSLVVLAEVGGDVQQVGEVRRKVAEVGVGEVDGQGSHPERLHFGPGSGVGEPGDPPHLVGRGEQFGDAEGDTAGGTGDEDLFALELHLVIIDQITESRNDGGSGRSPHAIDASLDNLLAALDLRPCGDDHFAVEAGPSARSDRVFGGQFLAQAVLGTSATVVGKDIHSMHATFLRPGTPGAPLTIEVTRLRDGRSIATREVAVLEKGEPLFIAIASFAGSRSEPDVTLPAPEVAPPEETPLLQALVGEAASGRRWIEQPPALELRLPELPSFLSGISADNPRSHWMRLPRTVGADHALNAALLAYASDFFLMDMLFRLHPQELAPGHTNGFSLDHAIWFHRPVRFDAWHLHTQEAVALVGDRGLARGVIHNTDGRCVASVVQEVLLRLGAPS